jgi:sugar diacid utilization regulator
MAGIALTGSQCVVGVAVKRPESHALRQRIRRIADARGHTAAAVFARDGAVLAMLAVRGPDPGRSLAASLAHEFSGSGAAAPPRIAYAGPHAGIAGARRAMSECLQGLRVLGLTGHPRGPAAYDELGIWTILGSADAGCLACFRDSTLGPLFEHDKRPASQLLPTLRALARAGFEWRPAAAELGVHPNTVRYRMSVITKLTGLDLATYQDRVKADIALRAAAVLSGS